MDAPAVIHIKPAFFVDIRRSRRKLVSVGNGAIFRRSLLVYFRRRRHGREFRAVRHFIGNIFRQPVLEFLHLFTAQHGEFPRLHIHPGSRPAAGFDNLRNDLPWDRVRFVFPDAAACLYCFDNFHLGPPVSYLVCIIFYLLTSVSCLLTSPSTSLPVS